MNSVVNAPKAAPSKLDDADDDLSAYPPEPDDDVDDKTFAADFRAALKKFDDDAFASTVANDAKRFAGSGPKAEKSNATLAFMIGPKFCPVCKQKVSAISKCPVNGRYHNEL